MDRPKTSLGSKRGGARRSESHISQHGESAAAAICCLVAEIPAPAQQKGSLVETKEGFLGPLHRNSVWLWMALACAHGLIPLLMSLVRRRGISGPWCMLHSRRPLTLSHSTPQGQRFSH
jgi:hypothetical protein